MSRLDVLDVLVDRFLDDYRQSDGGWAQISPKDMELLGDIIYELIDLKCDRDADGDWPIEFRLVNRRTHERLHYHAVPYREQKDRVIPFAEFMQILSGNLHQAAGRLDTEVECEYAEELRKSS